MTAAAPSFPHCVPPGAPDPVGQAALAELLQLGMAVARVASRLADMEGRAVEALAAAASDATRAVLSPHASLGEAIVAGHGADASDAARDAIAARLASIADSFDKAARAVRRTVALQARLADPRGGRASPAGDGLTGNASRSTTGGRAANDPERAERLDRPDWGDEIAGRTDAEIVRDIHRDLATAAVLPGMPGAAVAREAGVAAASPASAEACRGVAPGIRARVPPAAPPVADTGLPEPDT